MEHTLPTVGHHVLVELFGCDASRTDDVVAVRDGLLAAVRALGATPVGEIFHRFSPQGVSGVVLIAESHLSCHTWPEAGYVAVDIYTCGDMNARAAVAQLRELFGARTWLVDDVVRGLVELAPETPVERSRAMFDRRRFHTPIPADPVTGAPSPGERRHLFAARGIVDVTGIVSPETFAAIRAEALGLIDRFAERRDLRLATTGNTRRSMSVVRSEDVGDNSSLVRELYTSRALLDPLEQITGEALHPCPKRDEEFLITKQHRRGDTHGWHWGDYSYAMIWILEAPPLSSGGSLQCVPHTSWNKSDPRILEFLTDRPIDTYGFGTGQIYLLRTDTTLHRTIPLTEDVTRIILNMTWATTADLQRRLVGDDRWWEDEGVSAALDIAGAPHAG